MLDIFLKLTAQMLEVDLIESCTAQSASRAMWSCATLSKHMPDSEEPYLYERLVDFYHQISGVLLTSQLSPSDCSYAMWAMAKFGYTLDQGSFDFLALALAGMLPDDGDNSDQLGHDSVNQSDTKLVVKALWSCAR
jgi:hypothetical protein